MLEGPTAKSNAIALARIGVVTDDHDTVAEWIDVHFNPSSLQLQLSNPVKDSPNQQRKQHVATIAAKLTLDLQFDTTDTGANITDTTRQLQAFVAPIPPAGAPPPRDPPPPVVLFEWGALKFKGIVESYKETLDYFSANGVPLRSSINLTLSRQDKVFDEPSQDAPASANDVNAPASSPAAAARLANDPRSARSIAAANGEENLRFGASASLTVGASITLKPPQAFASAGAGAGLGISVGAAAGAGVGVGLGAAGGASLGAGAGIGVGVVGGPAIGAEAGAGVAGGAGLAGLARLSATEGAFAGLRTQAATTSPRLDAARLLPSARSATLRTDRGASFQLGGKATVSGATGLRADVGLSGAAPARLEFDAR